ncbi:MAG: prolyl oligopeptidase family serine peptidase [Candidatus Bathyarchaeota archaeon]|nr:prolyl oligopeptidase family serine peptidase [Candidatus Bathyarchaeota archaeon]
MLTIPAIYSYKISKNSRYVAFTWKNVHPNLDVFLVPTDGSRRPIALTETPEATFIVDFAPDSKSVIVGEDKNRNERVRLFEVKIAKPREMIPLTEEDPPFFLRGGMLHPNRKWLVYGANYDLEKKKEVEPTWVYRQNLENRDRIVLAKPKKPTWLYPQLNKQGTHVLYNRKELHPKGEQYWLVDIEGEEDRETLNFGPKAKVEAVWLPDGRHVGFITETKNGKAQKYYSLGIYDIETEEITWLIDNPDRNIERIHSPINSHHLIALEYQKATVTPSIINLTNMKEKFLPKIKGSLLPIGPVTNEEWVGLYYSSTQPHEIVKFNLDNVVPSRFQTLTHVWERTTVKREDLTPAEDFWWKAKDGLKIHGWLYSPKTASKKAIVYVHGGPTAHSEDAINPQIQYFTSRGFNVLDPNYRGSTGYGVEFEDLIRVSGWGSDEQEDIWSGIKALMERGIAKKGKIGVTGTSYGGYSSWYAITKASELVSAAVPICGMTDLVVDYKTTRPDLRPYSEEMMGGNPKQVPQRYYERSPINFVHQIKGRLMIVQGARDPNVTPRNVEEVRKRLDNEGIDYDLLVFEDEGHGILKTKNQKILFKKIADFFAEALE